MGLEIRDLGSQVIINDVLKCWCAKQNICALCSTYFLITHLDCRYLPTVAIEADRRVSVVAGLLTSLSPLPRWEIMGATRSGTI